MVLNMVLNEVLNLALNSILSLSEILTIGKLPTLREQGLNLQQYVKKFLNYENVHYVNEMTQQNCRGPYVTFLEDLLFKRHL